MASKVFIVSLTLFAFSCSSSQKEINSGKMIGSIYVIGNEPFTSLAIEGPEGKMYRISASKKIEQRLRGLQGKKVEVEYSKLSLSAEGYTIIVDSVREIRP